MLSGCQDWCRMKLLPSRRKFWVLHTIMCQFTVSLFLKPHMLYTCVFSCNLPPGLLAKWLGSVTYHCGNGGGGGGSWRWKFSRHSCWDSNLRPFIRESVTLPPSQPQLPLYKNWKVSLMMESHTLAQWSCTVYETSWSKDSLAGREHLKLKMLLSIAFI